SLARHERGSRHREVEPCPGAPLTGLQDDLAPLHFNDRSVRLAIAVDEEWNLDGLRLFEERILRADEPTACRLVVEDQPRAHPAPFVDTLRRPLLRKMLIGAVAAKHIGRAHAAEAAVMVVVRRTRWIIRRQVVERRGDAYLVEV